MRLAISLLVALIVAQVGCTAQSLRRNTIRQTNTWMDVQYHQVMDNLAMVANNPDVLPCFSTADTGTSDVSDTITVAGGVTIPPLGTAGTGFIDPAAKRQVKDNWSLTQATGPEKVRAMSLALRYALSNDPYLLVVHDHGVSLDAFCYPRGGKCCPIPPQECVGCPLVPCRKCEPCLRDYPGEPGYYFNVAYELRQLPPGWVHAGTKKQVPSCARYTACCGDTYIWVTEQDMGALSQFTLVLLEIAHHILNQAYYPYPDQIAVTPKNRDFAVNCHNCVSTKPPDAPPDTIWSITVPVDAYGNIVIVKDRIDSLYTSDTKVKSAVAAAIKSN